MSTITVTVRRRLEAPAAALFDVLVDPARFATVRGVRSVEILRSGRDGDRSVGTVRRVDLVAGHLVEEIVGLEAPARFDYLIRGASVPFDHRFGRIELADRGDHTEAAWTSTVALGRPPVGAALGVAARPVLRAAFATALGEMDRAARRRADGR
ncbi:MAG: SRPBCC family protein [Nocardioides sp.]|uniref:SRPBCC family protein n=1 Tax=Nocardioides sp. TaxID=35761 RepID=UPI0039E5B303